MSVIKDASGNWLITPSFTDKEIEDHRVEIQSTYDTEDVNPNDSHNMYHTLGQIELLMHSVEYIKASKVVNSNQFYYNQAHRAFSALFDLSQMLALDWFDKDTEGTEPVTITEDVPGNVGN